jgi:hypothetical protein
MGSQYCAVSGAHCCEVRNRQGKRADPPAYRRDLKEGPLGDGEVKQLTVMMLRRSVFSDQIATPQRSCQRPGITSDRSETGGRISLGIRSREDNVVLDGKLNELGG